MLVSNEFCKEQRRRGGVEIQRRNGGEEEKVESRDPDLAGGAKNKLKRLPVAWWAMALQCCCTAAYRKSPRTPSRELVWKFVSQSEGLWRPACQSDERILPEEFQSTLVSLGVTRSCIPSGPSPCARHLQPNTRWNLVRVWCGLRIGAKIPIPHQI